MANICKRYVFHRVRRCSSSQRWNLFNLAIWHEKSKTLVWRAMNNDSGGVPVSVDETARVVLKPDGRLALDSTSAGILSGTSTTNLGVARAAMRDDGNLVLLSSIGDALSQSFEHPTDTLLPNQQFAGSTRLVSSNQRYYLAMDRSEVALYFQGYWLEPYWRMKTSDIGGEATKNIPPRLNFTSDGMLVFYDGNGESWSNPTAVLGLINDTSRRYASDYGRASVRRLKLDDDGNLRIYSLAAEESWSVTWQAVLLECDIFGKCGRFGICTYRPMATCTCPPGFHPTNATDMM